MYYYNFIHNIDIAILFMVKMKTGLLFDHSYNPTDALS